MNKFAQRSNLKELLDREDIPFKDIKQNMQELNFINSKLGGHQVTLDGFRKLLQNRNKISICETGCGGGDNMTAVYKWCVSHSVKARFSGIDINPHCIAFATAQSTIPNVHFITSDYKEVVFANKPDIVFCSLFCHHFSDDDLIGMFQWMDANSNVGFFINDLHRNFIAYHFIRLASRIFSRSYMVKHDAPLSVLRGFRRNELKRILDTAGIKNYSIQWKWAFRYLVTVAKEPGI